MSGQSRDTLLESLQQYENQLVQIKLAILATPEGTDRDDLDNLQKDIEELISLTQENLSRLDNTKTTVVEDGDELSKEYALFKAELAELDCSESNESQKEDQSEEETNEIGPDIEDELESLKGSKCQAPRKQKWGDVSYHNALVVGVEVPDTLSVIDHIEVRVLFVNPTEMDMVPCPYYLDGECKFSDEQCHYSHGELVPLSDIKEYREPDFRCIKEGCSVLAKHKDKLWKRARVITIIDDNQCKVKFDSGGSTADVDVHELLPLDDNDQEGSDSSDSSSTEVDEEGDYDKLVQLSLLRTPASLGLGEWEKHTKGIGSRLMAGMGYVPGTGLGKHGEGRLEPVEAVVFPPGKSLDHCMALREAAGGDTNLFKAARKHRKQQQQELNRRKKEYEKEKTDVFGFINSKLAGPSTSVDITNQVSLNLTSSTSRGLNVERFKLGEDIRRTEKDVAKLKESLKRQDKGSASHNTLFNKLQQTQSHLDKLQNSEKSIVREQNQRQNRKKLAVF